jgi:ABC-type anion transport system duplicated permease subunit
MKAMAVITLQVEMRVDREKKVADAKNATDSYREQFCKNKPKPSPSSLSPRVRNRAQRLRREKRRRKRQAKINFKRETSRVKIKLILLLQPTAILTASYYLKASLTILTVRSEKSSRSQVINRLPTHFKTTLFFYNSNLIIFLFPRSYLRLQNLLDCSIFY